MTGMRNHEESPSGHKYRTGFTVIGLIILLVFCQPLRSQTFPLKISASGRYLEDQGGKPFFLNGDAAWSIVVQATYAEADYYLTDRAARGFNAILVNLIDHQFGDRAPANIAGSKPFTGRPFATPNEVYFAYADSVIARASQLGMVVLLFPIYLGYGCGDQGWCAEVKSASIEDMRKWGRYVGGRYKQYPNIIWVIGGDTDPEPVRSKVDGMVAALREADSVYPDRLITTHSERATQATTHWPQSWVTLNNIYTTWVGTLDIADLAFNRTPVMPFFLIEGSYENEKATTSRQIRLEAYRTILRGGCGHVFGNCPIWGFGTSAAKCGRDWKSQLGGPGSRSMIHCANLFLCVDWTKLTPDRAGAIVTAGADTGAVTATFAYASDSSVIVGFLPSRRAVTINPSSIRSDSILVWWYDPSCSMVLVMACGC